MGKRLVIGSRGETSPVAFSWYSGTHVQQIVGGFDGAWHGRNWASALSWVCANCGDKELDELHLWSHGAPGSPYMGDDCLDLADHGRWLDDLALRVHHDSVIWFRMCSVFHGRDGINFAYHLAEHLRCTVVGHTFKIGFPWHSGTRAHRHGRDISWSRHEGSDGKGIAWSSRKAPRTVTCFHNRVPGEWL